MSCRNNITEDLLRCVKSPRKVGIGPWTFVFCRLRCFILTMFAIAFGMVPVKSSQSEKVRNTRLDKLPQPVGMVPAILLPSKSKWAVKDNHGTR